ncbi:MAG TPA: hypothetical protein PLC99_12300 [Verrucomicrobiota bacterium]|nr:hypothetical protein [Verrucomicrobiota bacterium]
MTVILSSGMAALCGGRLHDFDFGVGEAVAHARFGATWAFVLWLGVIT